MNQQKSRKILEVVGQTVIAWTNDFDLTLRISGGDDHTGFLMSNFTISKKGKEIYAYPEMEAGQKISLPMKELVGAKILEAVVNSKGDLTLSFEDDRQLLASHSDDIEAWELRWLNKQLIVSLPGGGFAEF